MRSLHVLMVLLLAGVSSAFGVLLQANFEGNSEVSAMTHADQMALGITDYEATPDGWYEYSPSVVPDYDIQVTSNTADPLGGAYQGSNCLRLYRSGDQASVAAPFARQTSGVVHMEWWMMLPVAHSGNAFIYFTDNPGDNNHNQGMDSSTARVLVSWEGPAVGGRPYVRLDSAAGSDWIDFTWKADVWEKWEIDANLDTKTWTVTVNSDGPRSVGGKWTSAPYSFNNNAAISGLVFFAASPSSQFYVDDILVTPEPVSMLLLALGGLAVSRRRG